MHILKADLNYIGKNANGFDIMLFNLNHTDGNGPKIIIIITIILKMMPINGRLYGTYMVGTLAWSGNESDLTLPTTSHCTIKMI